MIRAPARCWVDPRVVARPSSIEGLGLLATAPIAKGEVVGTLGGRVIDDSELRRISGTRAKYNSAAIGEGANFLLEDDEVIARGNHSCDSNLSMRDEFTLEARRHISTGEEVMVDFALQTAMADWKMACNCGSPRCRKVVGHFSPFLNSRIEGMDAED